MRQIKPAQGHYNIQGGSDVNKANSHKAKAKAKARVHKAKAKAKASQLCLSLIHI